MGFSDMFQGQADQYSNIPDVSPTLSLPRRRLRLTHLSLQGQHEAKLSHELLGGAAAFEAARL